MRDNFSFNTEQFVAVLLLLTRCNSSCESMGVGLDFLQELILKSYQADTKFGGGLDIEDLDVEVSRKNLHFSFFLFIIIFFSFRYSEFPFSY